MRYKPSQFNVLIRDYPEKGSHLVYNTLSRAIVQLSDEGLEALMEPSRGDRRLVEGLVRLGMAVPEEVDEGKRFEKLFEEWRRSRRFLTLVVLTTLRCPMACVYCFERDVQDGSFMSDEVADELLGWVEGKLEGVEALSVLFYGGEPLLNVRAIKRIGEGLSRICGERGVRFGFGIVTGGTLLSERLVGELKGIGLRWVQVTLDGDKEAHDRRRPYKDGRGTFDEIMDNLSRIAGKVGIRISCNVDRSNLEGAYRLVDLLSSLGYAGRGVRMSFGRLCSDLEGGLVSPNLSQGERDRLVIYAAERGFIRDLRPPHKICAMLRRGTHLVVNTNGEMYSCPLFIGRGEEFIVGGLGGEHAGGAHEKLEGFELPEECLRCGYAPICGGGCRYDALVGTGDIAGLVCERGRFDVSVPTLIKAHYRLGLSGQGGRRGG